MKFKLLQLLFLMFSTIVNAQIEFNQEKVLYNNDIHAPGAISTTYSADLDGDSDLDIILGSTGKLAWYENDGAGDFSKRLTQVIDTFGGNTAPDAIFAIDFDNDTDLDIVIAHEFEDIVLLYLNNGDGTFGSAITVTEEINGPVSIVAFDIDGDTINDIVVGASNDETVSWFKNNGDGSFQNQQIISAASGETGDLMASDLDGDNVLDLIIGLDNGALKWIKSNNDGTFGAEIFVVSQMDSGKVYDIADIDNDGDLDIVSQYNSSDNSIGYFINDGSGSFSDVLLIDTPFSEPRELAAKDFDNDGLSDIIIISSFNDNITLYKNLGDIDNNGIIVYEAPVLVFENLTLFDAFSVGDYNGDGMNDLVSASNIELYYIENTGNLMFTIDTIGFQIYSTNNIVSADIDSDGDMDILVSQLRRLFYFENDGNGNYGNPINLAYLSDDFPNERATFDVGDFNSDGHIDIALTLNGLYIYLNDGLGNFTRNLAFPSIKAKTIIAKDFNGDGIDDMMLNVFNNNQVTLYANDGSGNFSAGVSYTMNNNSNYLLAEDIDLDGDLDVFTDDVAWFQNNGDGTFEPVEYFAGGGDSTKFVDIDGDGLKDIFADLYGENGVMGWLRNEGGGTFGNSFIIIDNISELRGSTVGDFDNDGDIDIVIGANIPITTSQSSTSVYLNNGDGTYGDKIDLDAVYAGSSFYSRTFELKDINDNGKIDIITTYGSPGRITIYENTSDILPTTFIPDDNFEQRLIDLGLDDTLDNVVLTANISELTSLDVSNGNISNPTGIEHFVALENLNFSQNDLQNINLENNINLSVINLSDNQLSQLVFTGLLAIENLDVSANNLETLNVANTNNSALVQFDARNNTILDCITVDDETAATNGIGAYSDWLYDAGVSFSLDCSVCNSTSVTAIGQDIDVSLDVNGLLSINPEDVDNGSIDFCGNAPALSIDINSFDCTNLGPNTIVLTAIDDSGNMDSTTAIVTVADEINPTVIGQDILIDLAGNTSIVIAPMDVDNGSFDNCEVMLTIDQDTFTVIGIYTITLTATDSSNNVQSVNVQVEVIDSTLGLNDAEMNNIKIYPNPVDDFIYVTSSGNDLVDKIEIYNILGIELIEITNDFDQINIQSFIEGVYIIKITTKTSKILISQIIKN